MLRKRWLRGYKLVKRITKNETRAWSLTLNIKLFCKSVVTLSQPVSKPAAPWKNHFPNPSLLPSWGLSCCPAHVLPAGRMETTGSLLDATVSRPQARDSGEQSQTLMGSLTSSRSLNVAATTWDHVRTLVMKPRESFVFLTKCIKFNFIQPPAWEQMEVSRDEKALRPGFLLVIISDWLSLSTEQIKKHLFELLYIQALRVHT